MENGNNTNAAPATELFFRNGTLFTGTPQRTEKGAAYTIVNEPCGRCGGAGGSDKWAHTGWTCFQCGGARFFPTQTKLYTAEKLAKMNAAQEKRQAKKQAERESAAQQREAERTARRDAFVAAHKEYFDGVLAVCGTTGAAAEIIATANKLANLTPAQREALDRMVATVQRKAASQFVGTVGERREFTCKLERFFDWSKPGQFGRTFYKYCHIMRDENGQVIKYIGSKILGGVTWERFSDYGQPEPVVDKEATLQFTATIEAHEDYKGEKQTVVAWPKLAA